MTGWRLKGSQEPLPAQSVRVAQMLGGEGIGDGSGFAGSNWLSGELPGLSRGGGSTIEWFPSGRLLRYVGVIRSKGDPRAGSAVACPLAQPGVHTPGSSRKADGPDLLATRKIRLPAPGPG